METIPNREMGAGELFPEIVSAVSQAERILIVSHDRPDGDAIGSTLGLGLTLEGLGKQVSMVNFNEVPESLSFLPAVERIERPGVPFHGDLVIALDAAEIDRINEAVWRDISDGIPLVVIDHHVSNQGYGTLCLVDNESPATGQILFQLCEFAGWGVGSDAACHFYAAISTDTGSFRYPSTTSETMRIGGELIRCGVEVGKINQQLYESHPRRRVEALRRLLESMKFDFSDRCVSVCLPLSLTRELGLQPGDTEGVIDVLRSVDSVVIAVFLEELPGGEVRVSSRSKSERFGVGEICSRFGGGGHTLAAGARLTGPLEVARDRFLSVVEEVLDGK